MIGSRRPYEPLDNKADAAVSDRKSYSAVKMVLLCLVLGSVAALGYTRGYASLTKTALKTNGVCNDKFTVYANEGGTDWKPWSDWISCHNENSYGACDNGVVADGCERTCNLCPATDVDNAGTSCTGHNECTSGACCSGTCAAEPAYTSIEDLGANCNNGSGANNDDYKGSGADDDDYKGSGADNDDYKGSGADDDDYKGSGADDDDYKGSGADDDYKGDNKGDYKGDYKDDFKDDNKDDNKDHDNSNTFVNGSGELCFDEFTALENEGAQGWKPWSDFGSCAVELADGGCPNPTVGQGCERTCGLCPATAIPNVGASCGAHRECSSGACCSGTCASDNTKCADAGGSSSGSDTNDDNTGNDDGSGESSDNNGSGADDDYKGSGANDDNSEMKRPDGDTCADNSGCMSGFCNIEVGECQVCNDAYVVDERKDMVCADEVAEGLCSDDMNTQVNCRRSCGICSGNTAPVGTYCNSNKHCDSGFCGASSMCETNNQGSNNSGNNKANGSVCVDGSECASFYCKATYSRSGVVKSCADVNGAVILLLNGEVCSSSDQCASDFCAQDSMTCIEEPLGSDGDDTAEIIEGEQCTNNWDDIARMGGNPTNNFISCATEKISGNCINNVVRNGCRMTCRVCVAIDDISDEAALANVNGVEAADPNPYIKHIAPGMDRGIPAASDFSAEPFIANAVVTMPNGDQRACGNTANQCVILDPASFSFGGGVCSDEFTCGNNAGAHGGRCGGYGNAFAWMPHGFCMCSDGWSGSDCKIAPPLSDLPSFVTHASEMGMKEDGDVPVWVEKVEMCEKSLGQMGNAYQLEHSYVPMKLWGQTYCPGYGLKGKVKVVGQHKYSPGDCFDVYTPENGCIIGQGLPERQYHADGTLKKIINKYKRSNCDDPDLAFLGRKCNWDESQQMYSGDYGYYDQRFTTYKPYASNLPDLVVSGCEIDFFDSGLPSKVFCRMSPSRRSSKYAGGDAKPSDNCNGYELAGTNCQGYVREWTEADWAAVDRSVIDAFVSSTHFNNLPGKTNGWWRDYKKVVITGANGEVLKTMPRDLTPGSSAINSVYDEYGNPLRNEPYKLALFVPTYSDTPDGTTPSEDFYRIMFEDHVGSLISAMSHGHWSMGPMDVHMFKPDSLNDVITNGGKDRFGQPLPAVDDHHRTTEAYTLAVDGHACNVDSNCQSNVCNDDKICAPTEDAGRFDPNKDSCWLRKAVSDLPTPGTPDVPHHKPSIFFEETFEACPETKPCENVGFADNDPNKPADFISCGVHKILNKGICADPTFHDACYKTCMGDFNGVCPRPNCLGLDGCSAKGTDYVFGQLKCSDEFAGGHFNPDIANWESLKSTYDGAVVYTASLTCIGAASANKNVIWASDDSSTFKSAFMQRPSTRGLTADSITGGPRPYVSDEYVASSGWTNPANGVYVEAHELLHVMGIGYHNEAYYCEAAIREAAAAEMIAGGVNGYTYNGNWPDCKLHNYGSPFSIMGKGSAALSIHVIDMYRLHWLHMDDFVVITQSGTYEVNPLLSSGAKKGVMIHNEVMVYNKETEEYEPKNKVWTLEWRTAISIDSSLADHQYVSNTNGLLINEINDSGRGILIDARPNEPANADALKDMSEASINTVWYDVLGKFTVKIDSVDHNAEKLTFTVTYDN